ncbi:Protein kinase-like domain [Pseudocohnilembus persalinus]|uniref:non-specific serine/threonine protein kinase n=1 Tax=Pseudocohnilembus persalinus TaxID=266149 RepID=A0A0V0QNT5_PSEPJ|nr:Protein kinase-like domain [Pseudocohnilembus persalinus]|eukprot:KRX03999.1 Protein kinase-like domain [Pseudocohnilembus persalinus]
MFVSKNKISDQGVESLSDCLNGNQITESGANTLIQEIKNLKCLEQLEKKLGSGHYAEVFLAKHKKTGQKVAVKILEPIGIHKITREYLILSLLQGHKNIVKLYDTVPLRGTKKQTSNLAYIFKEQDGEVVILPLNVSGKHLKAKALFVFEYIKSPSLSKMEKYMNDYDIRCAIYDVLKALAYMHNKGIFHRDIKPGNIMYNINKKRATVLDFGLAEFFHVSQPYHYKVATRNYKAPEILLNYTCYDHAVDLWATGVTMGQLITKIKPFFSREKDYKVLQAQTKLLGTQDLLNYMKRLNIKVDKYFASQFKKFHKYAGFEILV